jgi:outer membrane lipoprotein-sorting protein
MNKLLPRFLAPALLAFSAFTLPSRAELPIIAKARAFLGSESALNAVKSVHYLGVLTSADPTDKTQVSIEIIFQAPYQQRIEAKSGNNLEITSLDNYDAWQRAQDPNDPTRWKLTLLGKEELKRLRANTWQNLAFFRGIERAGGKVIDQGDATVEGIVCRKVAFVHDDDIVFYRYFEQATGRLVLTETESGGSIREKGEIVVNGVRFPKTIINTSKHDATSTQTITINFSQITVNETFPDSVFAIPSLSAK